MTPAEYCQQKAAASGSSFYYSFRFLPEPQREAIQALYAFCREVDDVVDECSDPGIARVKLQWWRDEIDRTWEGQPQHPVARALHAQLAHFDLPREYFHEIVDGMEMDLDQHRYDTFSALSLYCYRVAGVVGLLSVEIFGYDDRRTLKYATDLGMALQLTNIIRDVREDAAKGRIYIPRDELARFGVSPEHILSYQTSPAFKGLLAHQAERARQYYHSAYRKLPAVDRYRQRSGLIMAAIYERTLDEIEADGFNVMDRRITLTPLRKLWIAWTTARREKHTARRFAYPH